MKTKLILATLLTVMSVAVFAANNSEVVYDSTSTFKVYYTGKTPSKVKITIYNNEGSKVFSETIFNKDGFVRPYNMNDMESGTYTFEINDGNGIETYEFDYNFPKTEVALGMNVQKLTDNRYLFMLGTTEKANVVIKIANDKGDDVYDSKEYVKSQFAQVFNFKNVDSSKYTFSVYQNGSLIKSTSL